MRNRITEPHMSTRQRRALQRGMGMTSSGYAAYQAYLEGCYAAECPQQLRSRQRRNPYGPGVRHDEWERGHRSADPMGDHHGRNR